LADYFYRCLAFTLQEEGGYVDDPADPGGATNMGITLTTFRSWSDEPSVGAVALQDMTRQTAMAIYRMLYWNPLRADALPPGVDLSVFDFGVNAGVFGSARLLQRAIGFSDNDVDGCIGPITLDAVSKADPRAVLNKLAMLQTSYYRSLEDFPTFGDGWLARTRARQQAALALVADGSPIEV
jgi:lysozyme family protein